MPFRSHTEIPTSSSASPSSRTDLSASTSMPSRALPDSSFHGDDECLLTAYLERILECTSELSGIGPALAFDAAYQALSLNGGTMEASPRIASVPSNEGHGMQGAGRRDERPKPPPRRRLVVGEAGAGKSTYLIALCRQFSKRGERIPLLIKLGRWSGSSGSLHGQLPPIEYAALEWLGLESQREILGHVLRQKLRRGQIILLLDGIDEIPFGRLESVSERLRNELRGLEDIFLVATSRPTSNVEDILPVLRLETTERLGELDMAQRIALAASCFGAAGDSSGLHAFHRALSRAEDTETLTGNPLLLRAIASLFIVEGELPASVGTLYDRLSAQIIKQRSQRWEGIHDFDEARMLVLSVLQDIGLAFLTQEKVRFSSRDLLEMPSLITMSNALGLPRSKLVSWVRDSGLISRVGPDQYEFWHRSFLEYFAGRGLAQLEPALMLELISTSVIIPAEQRCRPESFCVLRWAAHAMNRTALGDIINWLLKNDDLMFRGSWLAALMISDADQGSFRTHYESIRSRFELLQRWCGGIVQMSRTVAGMWPDGLLPFHRREQELFSHQNLKRRHWSDVRETMMKATSYEKAAVHEVIAQFGLTCAGDLVIREMRSGNSWKSNQALGAIGGPRHIDELINLLRDRDAVARVAAALALGALHATQAMEAMTECLSCEDWELREAALQALPAIPGDYPEEAIVKCLEDTNREVCTAALHTISVLRLQSAAPVIISLMPDWQAGVIWDWPWGIVKDAVNTLVALGREDLVLSVIQIMIQYPYAQSGPKHHKELALNIARTVSSDRLVSKLKSVLAARINCDHNYMVYVDDLLSAMLALGAEDMHPLFDSLLSSNFGGDILGAIEALSKARPGSVDVSVQRLLVRSPYEIFWDEEWEEWDDWELRCEIDSFVPNLLFAVCDVGGRGLAPLLIDLLDQEEFATRADLIIAALASTGVSEASSRVVKFLKTADAYTRTKAVHYLVAVNAVDCIDAIADAVRQYIKKIGVRCRRVLKKLGDCSGANSGTVGQIAEEGSVLEYTSCLRFMDAIHQNFLPYWSDLTECVIQEREFVRDALAALGSLNAAGYAQLFRCFLRVGSDVGRVNSFGRCIQDEFFYGPVLEAVVQLDLSELLPELRALMKSSDGAVTAQAASAVARLGGGGDLHSALDVMDMVDHQDVEFRKLPPGRFRSQIEAHYVQVLEKSFSRIDEMPISFEGVARRLIAIGPDSFTKVLGPVVRKLTARQGPSIYQTDTIHAVRLEPGAWITSPLSIELVPPQVSVALPSLPTPTPLSRKSLPGWKKRIALVVLTVADVELHAVLRRMEPPEGHLTILKLGIGPQTFFLGRLGAIEIALTRCGMGSLGRDAAILSARAALDIWRPGALLMVGIAFGKDPAKQAAGDVLVASQVISYEPQRVGDKQTTSRGPIVEPGPILLDRFKHVLGWEYCRSDGSMCKLHVGPLLSGEKLVDDPAFKAALFKAHPQAIGGEMEAVGVYAAASQANTEWLVVKAVCDWADGKKHDGFQVLAADTAASLVQHVLSDPYALEALRGRR